MEKKFNLLDEPWIKVMDKNLKITEMSLIDVLENANSIKALAGETKLQDFAIERLLLAIAITIFYTYDENGNESLLNDADIDFDESDEVEELVLNRWTGYKNLNGFPKDVVRKYLKLYDDRFWLFHPETPFYQVPDMVKNGKKYANDSSIVNILGNIKESNNSKSRHHFSMACDEGLTQLENSELARWLINLNGYSVNVKYNKAAPGENKPAGVGRLGQLGIVKIKGNNLYEELLMNLTPLKIDSGSSLWNKPNPVWNYPVKIQQNCLINAPDNLPELYTLQSRRIHLNEKDNRVESFNILGGDFYSKEDDLSEQMTIWRWNNDKKSPHIIPKKHDVSIQAWREFSSLMVGYNNISKPGIVRWLELLKENNKITEKIFTIESLGLIYGDGMSYTFGNYVDDSITMSMDLLSTIGSSWLVLIVNEIEKSEKVVDTLYYNFSSDMSIIYGQGKDYAKNLKNKLATNYFSAIDSEFRKWLVSIEPEISDKNDKQLEWEKISKRIADENINNYINELDDRVYASRKVEKRGILSVSKLYNSFIFDLNNLYPTI